MTPSSGLATQARCHPARRKRCGIPLSREDLTRVKFSSLSEFPILIQDGGHFPSLVQSSSIGVRAPQNEPQPRQMKTAANQHEHPTLFTPDRIRHSHIQRVVAVGWTHFGLMWPSVPGKA